MKTLIIFARAPQMGRVKTRLARGIGAVGALKTYRALLTRTITRVSDARWQTRIAATPDIHPFGAEVLVQGRGDLGARMSRVFRMAMKGAIVIIGTDCPDISRAHVARAFAALGRADAVIGPAEDGGYWLIGLRRTQATPPLFRSVRWSSPHTLADTLGTLPGNWRVEMLDTLGDVDEAEDLFRLTKPGRRII